MMDFTNALMRCHALGYIMLPGREKTPKQCWEDACAKVVEWQAKYDGLDQRKKEMATGRNTLAKIDNWKAKVVELEPFKDDDPLSATAKSYLKRYYGFLKYGKWSVSKEKGNKYISKGKLAEEDSIDLLCKLESRMLRKNDIRLENDFLSGEPDLFSGESIFTAEYVYDIKTSWDMETFLDNLGKDLNPIYWWQMQGYFALTGARYGEVSYCLVNTPESIIEDEKYRLAKRMDAVSSASPAYLMAEVELVGNLTFDDIPENERRLNFEVERDDEAIENVYKRVQKCREHLFEIQELHLTGKFAAKTPELNEIYHESLVE